MRFDDIVVEPDALDGGILDGDLVVVDLCEPEVYASGHIPGAIHLPYSALTLGRPPAPGLLPERERLFELPARLGLHIDSRLVAYDDKGCGKASRLVWTLHYLGFRNARVLNGGRISWVNEGFPVSLEARISKQGSFIPAIDESVLASFDYVASILGNPDYQLLDSRSPAEYDGADVRSARGGHVPGAINLDWRQTIDSKRNMRLKPRDELLRVVEQRGFDAAKEVIAYCQTHHRSSHGYVMLKSIGFDKVRGYDGSWSQWGNREDAPIENPRSTVY